MFYDAIDRVINSKIMLAISGLTSIISFIAGLIVKDDQLPWFTFAGVILLVLLMLCLISYNNKIIGKLDSINMHIIGDIVQLENDEEDDTVYVSKESSIILLTPNLSRDRRNEQLKAILEIRLPSYLNINIEVAEGVRIEESNRDFYKISVPLTKDITYVKIKSFIVEGNHSEKFMTSSKKIDIKLSSSLLSRDKDEHISVEI